MLSLNVNAPSCKSNKNIETITTNFYRVRHDPNAERLKGENDLRSSLGELNAKQCKQAGFLFRRAHVLCVVFVKSYTNIAIRDVTNNNYILVATVCQCCTEFL